MDISWNHTVTSNRKIKKKIRKIKDVGLRQVISVPDNVTFKGKMSTRNFEGLIDESLHIFSLSFVRSCRQLSRVFDLRPLSYLKH